MLGLRSFIANFSQINGAIRLDFVTKMVHRGQKGEP
jgi:hypothetical protein